MSEVHFVSLISRDDKPLYIQSFDDKSDVNKFLKYNFLSHMALDVFALPASSIREQYADDNEGVMLLFVQEDVSVYGLETNNGLKIVAGVSAGAEDGLKSLLNGIYKCYLRTVCNPFNNVQANQEIESTAFDESVRALVVGAGGKE